MHGNGTRIALGKRLRSCRSFRCIGVCPNWTDYPPEDREAIRAAEAIFYPTPLYEDLFTLLGKETFPRNSTRFMGNKIRQTQLFQFLGIAHPRTRIYYGKDLAERIWQDFPAPFIAKTPVGSSKGKGVYLIGTREALCDYLDHHNPAYIQEYLPLDRDLRVVLIRGRVIHAYWRIHAPGEFRNNVALGARISSADVPQEALDFAVDAARRCRFDEVGLDIACHGGEYLLIEANMVYGQEGFRQSGLNLYALLARMDCDGTL